MNLDTLFRWYQGLVNDTLLILAVWLMLLIIWPSSWPGSPELAAYSGPTVLLIRIIFFIRSEMKLNRKLAAEQKRSTYVIPMHLRTAPKVATKATDQASFWQEQIAKSKK
jgi:hypothetical protein